MEIVSRGVGKGQLVGLRRGAVHQSYLVQVIFKERAFIGTTERAAQTVVANILILAGIFIIVECIHYRLSIGHTSPDGGVHTSDFLACGQTVLETLAAIPEYVLADITQIDIQFTTRVTRILYKGVHQPEFQCLDVLGLEIGIV